MARPTPLQTNDWHSLEEGETLRVPCDSPQCQGKNDAFTITRILNGCIYNCYRCGLSGIIFKGSNPGDALKRIGRLGHTTNGGNRNGNNNNDTCRLPRDHVPLVTHDKAIPPHAYAWFYQYELDEDDFDERYISYSPSLERVIIPFWGGTKLIGWQGRDIYYNRNIDLYNKGFLKRKPIKWYTNYSNTRLFYTIYNNIYNYIILVEDVISAIKVHNHYGFNVVALLNSTLNNNLIDLLELRKYQKVIVWLDPDAHVKSIQGALRWQSMGVPTSCVRTPKDPKDQPYLTMPILPLT